MSEPLSQHSLTALRPFAAVAVGRALSVQVSARRWRNQIEFVFSLSGRLVADLQAVHVPDLVPPESRLREHELWKSTCLEIFIGPAGQQSYFELNLSPAGHWNVYSFDRYRAGMREASEAGLQLKSSLLSPLGDRHSWVVVLHSLGPKGEVAELLSADSLVMGAAAVLEYQTGEREYWAIVHEGDRPDFHRRESFRLAL